MGEYYEAGELGGADIGGVEGWHEIRAVRSGKGVHWR